MTDIAKIRTGKVKGTMNSNNLSDYYYNHSFMERLRKRLPGNSSEHILHSSNRY